MDPKAYSTRFKNFMKEIVLIDPKIGKLDLLIDSETKQLI